MVIEQGYTWTRVPGTDVEVRVLGNKRLPFGTACGLCQAVARWVLNAQTGQKAMHGHEYR
jgi:hypothetical protein